MKVVMAFREYEDDELTVTGMWANINKKDRYLGEQSSQLVTRMEKVITEADEDREKFVYLAGIGLMTEFIFHELERAVAHTMDLLSRGSLRQATIESLKEQLTTLHKRIAAFDELTGEKRQFKHRKYTRLNSRH